MTRARAPVPGLANHVSRSAARWVRRGTKAIKNVSLIVVDRRCLLFLLFFFNAPATTEIYTLSLHDALPIFISLTLLAVMIPFIILTAIAVFLETGRPILYSQTRVGMLGKEFRIYKFRSMRQDAEKDGQARWASANDNRVTRVGAFIRNTRLDELPQIYNVIKGEMSIVGPRPERPEFVTELKEKIPFYDTRHYVKPGLMGWAQLKYPYGASVEDARGKLEYDLYYSKNHSLLMDFLIMIQTVEVILLGKGVR